MGRKTRPSPREIDNLKPTPAPDCPGQTVAISARVRLDQKEWLDRQEESHGFLVRRALDLLIDNLETDQNRHRAEKAKRKIRGGRPDGAGLPGGSHPGGKRVKSQPTNPHNSR